MNLHVIFKIPQEPKLLTPIPTNSPKKCDTCRSKYIMPQGISMYRYEGDHKSFDNWTQFRYGH